MEDQVLASRVSAVRDILVVLSGSVMAFDRESLRYAILRAYPDASVFFQSGIGSSLGPDAPCRVDLVIDFTAPRQRQTFFRALGLRRMAKTTVGRSTGFLRQRMYDRLTPREKQYTSKIEQERVMQREVLALAGVSVLPSGAPLRDVSKSIALELPRMRPTSAA